MVCSETADCFDLDLPRRSCRRQAAIFFSLNEQTPQLAL
jgi:hypothetical protein